MIPSVVARQTRQTLLDYLRTTFDFSDAGFSKSFYEFLDSPEGLFRGPYVDVRLPFRKRESGAPSPLEIRPLFDPYRHQHRSFLRLHSREGHQPQHTLVTTGTGSGKTECFLFPILDHCYQHRDQPGIKAILLYPMNALATDQARRLAELLWNDERLKGQVTAGLYVGGKGQHGSASRSNLVDQRDVPPDLLLTNYKMLDFLLLRPEDRRLWRHNEAETLRYLVLDELHTYDGAQGSDVACLIRRLKSRLGSPPGSLCCVGTSATIGGPAKSETLQVLTEFAGQVFDETFYEDSVISEDRYEAAEVLGTRPVDRARFRPRDNRCAGETQSARNKSLVNPRSGYGDRLFLLAPGPIPPSRQAPVENRADILHCRIPDRQRSLLDFLNVRGVFTPGKDRFFLTSKVRVVPEEQILGRLRELDDPARVLLETEQIGKADWAPPKLQKSYLPVVSQSEGDGDLQLALPGTKVRLLASSVKGPSGWQARSDHGLLDTVRVHYTFLGVIVPEGVSQIHLVYRPPGLLLGAWLSLLAALAILGLAFFPRNLNLRGDDSNPSLRA